MCHFVNGCKHELPVASVKIECPYYKGETNALFVQEPTCDVIIGNVEGAVHECCVGC